MYKYIVNPETNRKVLINSQVGNRVLKQYYKQLGGNSCIPVDETYSYLNLKELVGLDQYEYVYSLLKTSNRNNTIAFLNNAFQLDKLKIKDKSKIELSSNSDNLLFTIPKKGDLKKERMGDFIKTNLKIKWKGQLYSFYYDMGFLSFECNINENREDEVNKYYEIDYTGSKPEFVEDS